LLGVVVLQMRGDSVPADKGLRMRSLDPLSCLPCERSALTDLLQLRRTGGDVG
jgi:hypothetical protein